MKKYETYKDSGIKWIGEIPEEWEVRKLGNLLKPISIKNHSELPLLSITREEGVILRNIKDQDTNHNFIPDDLSGYKMIRKGQFGMNKMKAWQGSYGISNFDGIVSPAYYIFKFLDKIDPSFFNIAIRSKVYIAFFGSASDGVRVGQWDLSKERMKTIPMIFPPLPEQTAIAQYLDDKTGKIDRAIQIKTQEIALLKERRQILIQEVVTGKKVFHPQKNTWTKPEKTKDSGVEWIGEIPVDWEVRKLKYCLNSKLKYGANESGVEYNEELPRYIRITDFAFGGKLSEEKKLSLTWSQGENYLLQDGDILFARSGATVGKSYQFRKEMSKEKHYAFAGYLIKANPNEKIILSDFLYSYTNSHLFDKWKESIFNKATIENIGASKYEVLPVLIPRIEAQQQIVSYLEKAASQIAQSIALKEQEIEKLKEYKTVLIDSAVTGKIKIDYEKIERG